MHRTLRHPDLMMPPVRFSTSRKRITATSRIQSGATICHIVFRLFLGIIWCVSEKATLVAKRVRKARGSQLYKVCFIQR
jgi:hypothetical protein